MLNDNIKFKAGENKEIKQEKKGRAATVHIVYCYRQLFYRKNQDTIHFNDLTLIAVK